MKAFGWFKGMKEEPGEENFDDYKAFKNRIPKEKILEHMRAQELAMSSGHTEDMFTGEPLEIGVYIEGEYCYPLCFLHYLENYDIGVPYEYEKHLRRLFNG